MIDRHMVISAALIGALSGCVSYQTPGGAVAIPEITEVGVAEALARQPAAIRCERHS